MRYTVTKAFRPKGSGSPKAAVGTELELTAAQARVFKAVGFVKEAEAKAAEPSERETRNYTRRDMIAEAPAAPVPAKKVAAKKVAAKSLFGRREQTSGE